MQIALLDPITYRVSLLHVHFRASNKNSLSPLTKTKGGHCVASQPSSGFCFNYFPCDDMLKREILILESRIHPFTTPPKKVIIFFTLIIYMYRYTYILALVTILSELYTNLSRSPVATKKRTKELVKFGGCGRIICSSVMNSFPFRTHKLLHLFPFKSDFLRSFSMVRCHCSTPMVDFKVCKIQRGPVLQ